MSFKEMLAHAAKDDPHFARSVQRLRLASWLFGIGVLLGIGFGVYAVAVNFSQGDEITRVTKKVDSACERKAGSKRCLRIQRRADERRSVASACVLFEKVDDRGRLLRFTRCGRPIASIGEGGEAQQPQSKGHQQPGPRGGAKGPKPGKGGSDDAPAPHPGGSDPGSTPPSAGAAPEQGHKPEATPPPKSLPEQATEKVEEVVGQVTGAAEGAVCGTVVAAGCSK